MKPLFADAHFFLALLSKRDASHQRAVEWFSRVAEIDIVTTAFVLLELADGMSNPPHREVCARFISSLREKNTIRIIGEMNPLIWRGFDLYRSRQDKEWPVTDCISFVVMAEEGLTEALTGDRHFEQAGFTALLLK
jgi:predicted nucleic acid-binding protein